MPGEQNASSEPPQARARVGYLGPEGTFTEEALLASAEEQRVEPVALASIYDCVSALREGEVGFTIVPIENSLEGPISVTLDLLAEDAGEVRIVGETLLRVHHALICAQEGSLEQIDTVITHPQVPGQCTRLLRGELAGARVLAASSTADAVRTVAAQARPGLAAIGTELAARIYGARVIRAGVEDRADNETRFVWLGREGAGSPPLRSRAGAHKTSLVFWGAGAEHAGWLVRCLGEFAARDINLTKIESRPRRRELGSYMFFADLEARAEEPLVTEAIAGLRGICEEVRVLGSYPAAAGAQARG